MSIPTLSLQEKDPFKVAAVLRQTVERANKLIDEVNDIIGLTDGDKGDITVSSSGATWTIDNDAVSNAKQANMAEATVKGRAAGAGTGDPTDLSADQLWAVARTATTMNVPSSKMTFNGTSAAEGGQFQMEKPATTSLAADVSVDINNNSYRVFENGDSARGFYVDLTECAAGAGTNLLSSGAILQVLQNAYTTNTDLTDQIPSDDTAPVLASEGTTILSQAITPASSSNKVLAEVHIFGASGTNNTDIVAALFRGSTCIQVAQTRAPTANFPVTLSFAFLDSPSTTSSTTYSVNVGPVGAVTIRMNGSTSTRLFGGSASCTLTLTEVKG